MTIWLIDTSVFCNILRVPGKAQHHAEVSEALKGRLRDSHTLLLPMATILEAGNHIAQRGSGGERRLAAQRFVQAVAEAIDGNAPWTPTPFFDPDRLRQWLSEFPDCAMRGQGLGDLSIAKEFEQQCRLHPFRRVAVWSLDRHLASLDRPARAR